MPQSANLKFTCGRQAAIHRRSRESGQNSRLADRGVFAAGRGSFIDRIYVCERGFHAGVISLSKKGIQNSVLLGSLTTVTGLPESWAVSHGSKPRLLGVCKLFDPVLFMIIGVLLSVKVSG